MTLQDLLRHTSGITYGGRGSTPVHKPQPASSGFTGTNMTTAEFIEKLGAAPLLYQPGTTWEYGLSVDVLGAVVEQMSGKSLGGFLQERLWGPLGMTDTSFTIPAEKHARFAKGLANDPDTGRPQSVLDLTKPLKQRDAGGGPRRGHGRRLHPLRADAAGPRPLRRPPDRGPQDHRVHDSNT